MVSSEFNRGVIRNPRHSHLRRLDGDSYFLIFWTLELPRRRHLWSQSVVLPLLSAL